MTNKQILNAYWFKNNQFFDGIVEMFSTFHLFASEFRWKKFNQNKNVVNLLWPLCMEIRGHVLCPYNIFQLLRILRPHFDVCFSIDFNKSVAVFKKNLNNGEKSLEAK